MGNYLEPRAWFAILNGESSQQEPPPTSQTCDVASRVFPSLVTVTNYSSILLSSNSDSVADIGNLHRIPGVQMDVVSKVHLELGKLSTQCI